MSAIIIAEWVGRRQSKLPKKKKKKKKAFGLKRKVTWARRSA